jgi:two-component system, chemotaxis family, chemotaxis protein CheY
MATALIVDNAAFMRMIIKNIMTKAGHYIVGEAQNGQEAVNLYSELHPDFVTMDITLTELDGIQATRKICTYDPQAKVIICSAMGQQMMVIDAIRAGAKDFVVKPFDEERFKEALKKIL